MNDGILEISKSMKNLDGIRHKEIIQLYSGIELMYIEMEIESNSFSVKHKDMDGIIQINYCKSGQMVWRMESGDYIYLNPGDFSLHSTSVCADSFISLPSGKYSGLTVFIDLKEVCTHPPELFGSADVSKKSITDKLISGGIVFMSGNEITEGIFSAFYGQPEQLRLAYQKIKTLELLLYLSKSELSNTNQLTAYQSEQIEVIKKIHDRLTSQMGERITIEELSRQYLMNPTTLKTAFKEVYGTSIAAHMRQHRMERAAKLLRETNMSVAEIAQAVGYDSQSKFAAVFKAYYQVLPREYRKK